MTGPTDPAVSPPPSPAPVSGWQQAATPRSAAGNAPTRLTARKLLIGFAIVLGAILLVAAAGAFLSDAPEPPPDCQPGTECGGPPPVGEIQASPPTSQSTVAVASPAAIPPGTVGIRAGTPVLNRDLGFQFEYSDWWAVDTSNTDATEVDLEYQGTSGDGLLIVAAVPTTEAGPQAYADQWFAKLKDWAPDLKVDDSAKNSILGPEIGFIDGVARTYAGSRSSAQSATTPVGISVVASSDGHTTAAMVLIVWNPDKPVGDTWLQYNIRRRAEIILKTFRWGPPS
jgi:hypothetical protein